MGKRLEQVNTLIKKELSQILKKEVDFPTKVLVTVTRVESSADLNQAKVYVSVLPEQRIKEVLSILEKLIYFLQQKLNKCLKMRPIPKIRFLEEKRTAEAGRIEEIIEQIYKKK